MTQSELHRYANRLVALNRAHDEAMRRRREKARQEAQRLAGQLYAGLSGLRGVYGFGSVFEPRRPFNERSDIDLAIDGGELIDAVRICLHSSFRVDVVDISDLDDPFVRGIRERAVRL
jgi:predicted nucleotidyltransferase